MRNCSESSTAVTLRESDYPSAKRKRETDSPPQLCLVKRPDVPDLEGWQNAAVLINKPREWTSFDVCNKLRRELRIKKVGHAGTLDPLATGLLVVCVGRATKLVDSFVGMAKEYSGTMRLGEATPSYDAETEVCQTATWEHLTDADLEAAGRGFRGEIMQKPPMYSAVKVGGDKLYNAARRGEVVEREARPVTVSRFDLRLDHQDRQTVHFYVECSKGTYVRSLCHDLGQSLGSAAHMTSLRREAIGQYQLSDAWPLWDLIKAVQAKRSSNLT